MNDKVYKFGIVKNDETEEEFFYSDSWYLEDNPNYRRITIAPRDNHVRIMLDLLKEIKPPYWILYVLVIPRSDNKPGRYQCARPLSFEEISTLVIKFSEYFVKDGRHHI